MILAIKYFDVDNEQIVIEYDTGNFLRSASYRDDEVDEWLQTHAIEGYIDPMDYQLLMRGHRDMLLLNSDWTQLPDVPLTEEQLEAWVTHRQALRDFPGEHPEVIDKETFDALVWPTPPEE